MTLPIVLLNKAGVLHVRDGHPWIYSDELAADATPAGSGPAAGLVALEGPAGRRRGYAVFNPRSRIPLRVVSRDPAADITEDFWRQRLDVAIAARATSLAPGEAACRWVHAEADGLPGLIIDRYADIAVLQAGCQWADELAPQIAGHLVERHGISGVLARHDGSFRRPEGLPEGVALLAGDVPHAVRWESSAVGGPLVRTIDPWTGQKTGAYLDQRENHRRAAELFDGIVLDPPAHAKRRGERDAALRGYKELNLRALRLLRPGGRLMACSCSFHVGAEEFLDVLRAAACDAARDVRVVERRTAASCHPHRLALPESSYLKVVVLEVTGTW
jgi:23S rRNA (cytosine1962-C5)-methyltransferase